MLEIYVQHSSPILITLTQQLLAQLQMNLVEITVDLDQLASEKPDDLDLHCFQSRIYPGSAC